MYRHSEKKLLKQQHVLHMSSQHGELRPTNGWDRFGCLGHPTQCQRASRLGSVTAWHSSCGRQPNFVALNRGRPYIRQGGHHVGHWPTFLVLPVTVKTMPWFTGEHGVVDGHITVSSGRLDLTDFMTQRSDDLHREVVINGAAVL